MARAEPATPTKAVGMKVELWDGFWRDVLQGNILKLFEIDIPKFLAELCQNGLMHFDADINDWHVLTWIGQQCVSKTCVFELNTWFTVPSLQ